MHIRQPPSSRQKAAGSRGTRLPWHAGSDRPESALPAHLPLGGPKGAGTPREGGPPPRGYFATFTLIMAPSSTWRICRHMPLKDIWQERFHVIEMGAWWCPTLRQGSRQGLQSAKRGHVMAQAER